MNTKQLEDLRERAKTAWERAHKLRSLGSLSHDERRRLGLSPEAGQSYLRQRAQPYHAACVEADRLERELVSAEAEHRRHEAVDQEFQSAQHAVRAKLEADRKRRERLERPKRPEAIDDPSLPIHRQLGVELGAKAGPAECRALEAGLLKRRGGRMEFASLAHRPELRGAVAAPVAPRQARVEVTRRSLGDVQLEGYAAVFNERSENLGGYRETIRPGAFSKALARADRPALVALFNHDPNLPLGRLGVTDLVVKEDARGLRYRLTLPDTSAGRDVAELVRSGTVFQSSFAFMVEPGRIQWARDGDADLRTILEVESLHDVSPVTRPAYEATSVKLANERARSNEKN
ncbi:MAG: HK97 family phage prohead protease [Myxococcota bacterium]